MTDLNETVVATQSLEATPSTVATQNLEATMPADIATPKPEATAANVTLKTPNASGNWNEQKGKLKAQYPILTDADLHYDNGKKDEMFTRIGAKIGKTKEELSAILTEL